MGPTLLQHNPDPRLIIIPHTPQLPLSATATRRTASYQLAHALGVDEGGGQGAKPTGVKDVVEVVLNWHRQGTTKEQEGNSTTRGEERFLPSKEGAGVEYFVGFLRGEKPDYDGTIGDKTKVLAMKI